jgi:hypothetical protein
MHFNTKNTLKSNRNHTLKHVSSESVLFLPCFFITIKIYLNNIFYINILQ